MVIPVYSYIRFSSKKQEKGDSMRRQTKGGEAWIAKNADKGYVAANLTLHDIGVSAFRGKNKHTGALKRFLEEIEAGRVQPGSILLVEHLDRLSRQGVGEAYALFTQILNAGVHIAVLKPHEQIYTRESVNSDLIGLLLPLIYFYLAFVESKTKSDRLRKVWDHKREMAKEGAVFDRRRPSWVDWDEANERFVLNHGAEAIRFIFERTAEGCGQRAVLKELVRKFTPIGTSRRWNSSFIQKVLNDRAVLGERVPKAADEEGNRVQAGKPIPNYYPSVVDEELWYRAQASKESNKRHKGPSSQFINIFSGLLVNAHDGFPMHVQTTRKPDGRQRRLVSYGHISEVVGADSVSVQYSDFEDKVLRYLHEVRPEDLELQPHRNDMPLREQELSGVELRLAQLREALANPTIGNLPTVLASVSDLEKRRSELVEEIAILRHEQYSSRPLQNVKSVVALLRETDVADRDAIRIRLRSLIGQLVKTIYLKPEKHYGRVYALVQIIFKSGGFKMLAFGPGFHFGFHEQTCLSDFNVDLTDRVAANSKSVFAQIAEVHAQPPEAPVVDVVPEKIGDAGEVWLRLQRSRMAKHSFRVVPAKVRRFVKFVGHCRSTSEAGRHWNDWVGWLKVEIAAGRMAPATARVTLSRSREFLRWLIQRGVVGDLAELNLSAEVALGLKDRKKEGAA
jgi:DNA invertase Pin-like site-specific DNA recombinase